MKKIVLLMAMIALASAPVSAQSLLERLANRAKNAAEQNIGNKVEQGVNDVLDGKVGKGKNKPAINNMGAHKYANNVYTTQLSDSQGSI